MFVIVKLVISLVADSNETGIIECMDCFISNDCKKYNIIEEIEDFANDVIEQIK